MKKFIFITLILGIFIFGLEYVIFNKGYYIDFDPNASITAKYKTEEKTIFIQNDKGQYEPFIIKGVDLASSIPGELANDYAIEHDTWLRWFAQIQDMGANTIRIYTIYNDNFYNAFYDYNKGREKPLYLLQGIQISDSANNWGLDLYSTEIYASLDQDARDMVDVIHGRKNITLNRMKGSGRYRKDVSQWVIGYLIGDYWSSDMIAYANHNTNYATTYQGKYFYTDENATVFETMLARIMDHVVSYESKKYKTQRLISFSNDPQNDPFEYDLFYAQQLRKYVQLDPEHILTTENLNSGYFASYRLYEFCPDFAHYFSADQKRKLTDHLNRLNQEYYYQGYTQLLANYHSIPVVITEYGFSTARGTDTIEGPMTEREQGQALVSTYYDIVNSGCSGAFINSWQDVWDSRTWNTSYAVDISESYRWHDIQNKGQGYGILAFDTNEEQSNYYVDGNSSEWKVEDEIIHENDTRLSVKYDEAYLYLLIEKKGLTENTNLYIPIDVTPKSGSKTSNSPRLTFEREVDFLLCLEGRDNSRMLVQSRYEALRENYLKEITGEDPFVRIPSKDAADFVPIQMLCKNDKLADETMTDEEIKNISLFDTYETGKLVLGNGNPYSTEYNSLADFCYGTDMVEIRIPWQLLNFYNPADMEVHDDYYVNYGVEGMKITELYMGLSEQNQEQPSSMAKVKLVGWDNVSYHERLKQSYEMIKERWGN